MNGIDFNKYYEGATYVPLEAAISFLEVNKSQSKQAIMDDLGQNGGAVTFNKLWPYVIFPCQNMTSFGVVFSKCSRFNSRYKEKRLLWCISAMLTRVEILWKLVTKVNFRTSKWHGWLLVYLTKKFFPSSKMFSG